MHKATCQTAKVTDYQEGNLSTNTYSSTTRKKIHRILYNLKKKIVSVCVRARLSFLSSAR
jgi:hypothetical protein